MTGFQGFGLEEGFDYKREAQRKLGFDYKREAQRKFSGDGAVSFPHQGTATGFSLSCAPAQGITADLAVSSDTHMESWTWPSATSLSCPFEAL